MKMYFIAIALPQKLDEKILRYKKWMADKYNCWVGLKSPAHITIVSPFWMEEEKQMELISDIKNVSPGVSAFTIATDNFSSFAPGTLFIAIEENKALNNLKIVSADFFRIKNYKMKLDARPFHPHITIATRDLHKKDFLETWNYFKNKNFKEKFTATGLSLLKHNSKIWDVVHEAKFAA